MSAEGSSLSRLSGGALCDEFVESPDPWAGTYCKLWAGHEGDHSAHYPPKNPTCERCEPYPGDPCVCGWDG